MIYLQECIFKVILPPPFFCFLLIFLLHRNVSLFVPHINLFFFFPPFSFPIQLFLILGNAKVTTEILNVTIL